MIIDEKVLAHIKATVERGIIENSSETQRAKWGLGEIESVTYKGYPGAKVPFKTYDAEGTIVFLYDYNWDLFDAYLCEDENHPKLILVDHMVTTWGLPEAIEDVIQSVQQ